MTIKELFDYLHQEDICREDYIVKLKYKYDVDGDYIIEEVPLLINKYGFWEWSWDWYEGQQDVEVLEFVPLEEAINDERREEDSEESV